MARRPTSRPMPRWLARALQCTACSGTLVDEQGFAIFGMDGKPRALCPDCATDALERYRRAERSVLAELETMLGLPAREGPQGRVA